MVKKYAYRLPTADGNEGSGPTTSSCAARNDDIHALLNTCKDQITRHYPSRHWDEYKRMSNEYELVYTAPGSGAGSCGSVHGLASRQPVSRSFFKLWEILHDFAPSMALPSDDSVTAAFLAEGPGGFVESFAAFRSARRAGDTEPDDLHCITLISHSRAVPVWKLQAIRRASSAARLHVHHGADGTGDLYRLANIDAFVGSVGDGACRLVTADGGFDFSGDFNGQERTSARLLMCEAYAALRLQRPGGALVLKLFDVRYDATVSLLHALRSSYADVHLVKPLTSRPANSEKYAVCTGFRGASEALMRRMRDAVASANPDGLPLAPSWFSGSIVHYNACYVARQISYIAGTIAMMGLAQDAQRRLLRAQLGKSIRWCHKYGIPISMRVLSKYSCMIVDKPTRAPVIGSVRSV